MSRILDHSSLDALVGGLRPGLFFRFRNVGTRKFLSLCELKNVETDGVMVCLTIALGGVPSTMTLKFMGGIVGQPPDCPPTGELRSNDGTAVQIWADDPPRPSVDGSLRDRLNDNLRGVFA